MVRAVYERDFDAPFLRALEEREFAHAFLESLGLNGQIAKVDAQNKHACHSGSIDSEIRLADGRRLLVENKIDAGYSVTKAGDPQPERYAASVKALEDQGIPAHSILLAPSAYLRASRLGLCFGIQVSHEALRHSRNIEKGY